MKSPFELMTDCPVEIKIYKVKSILMIMIVEYMRDNNLNQKQMAEICGISQPRFSSIVNAKFNLLSIDFLMRISLKLGIKVDINKQLVS